MKIFLNSKKTKANKHFLRFKRQEKAMLQLQNIVIKMTALRK